MCLQQQSDIYNILKKSIPILGKNRHKGQNGKIGIIGGSFEYTGAPYYAAIASLKGGADLSHIFCTKQAAIPIKSYSPEVIVHPSLIDSKHKDYHFGFKNSDNLQLWRQQQDYAVEETCKWYIALHSIVIGNGLGRDLGIASYLYKLVQNQTNQIMVFDADFFWYMIDQQIQFPLEQQNLQEFIKNKSQQMIFTPNQVEFDRLWNHYLPGQTRIQQDFVLEEIDKLLNQSDIVIQVQLDNFIVHDTVLLSQKLNYINIVKKGQFDVITNGKVAYIVKSQSSLKRCGGQGDILAGLIGLYTFWNSRDENILLGCIMACIVTRSASNLAFQKHKFSLTAYDIIFHIQQAFENEFI